MAASITVRFAVVANDVAIGAVSRQVAGINWCEALFTASILRPGHPRHANHGFLEVNGTGATIESRLPVVRTQCNTVSSGEDPPPNNLSISSHEELISVRVPMSNLTVIFALGRGRHTSIAESTEARAWLPVSSFDPKLRGFERPHP